MFSYMDKFTNRITFGGGGGGGGGDDGERRNAERRRRSGTGSGSNYDSGIAGAAVNRSDRGRPSVSPGTTVNVGRGLANLSSPSGRGGVRSGGFGINEKGGFCNDCRRANMFRGPN